MLASNLLSMFLMRALGATSLCLVSQEESHAPALCIENPLAGNDATENRLEMYIQPTWKMWSQVNFPSGFASGIMAVKQLWRQNVSTYISASHVAELPRIMNFLGSKTNVDQQPILLLKPSHGDQVYQTQRLFVGDFKQSFDPQCYPIDHQELHFEIGIDVPAGFYFDVYLGCGKDFLAKDASGNPLSHQSLAKFPKNVHTCTQEMHYSSSGFYWNELVCQKRTSSSIDCAVVADRSRARIMFNFLMPSVLVSTMSFASFFLPIGMSMPRIATTMIAMLTQINLKATLAKNLPSSGPISWLEEYFMVATAFMFFNLVCHVAALRYDKLQYPVLSDLVDDMAGGIAGCLFVIIPLLRFLSKGCPQNGGITAFVVIIVVLTFILLFALIARAVVARKEALQESRKSLRHSVQKVVSRDAVQKVVALG